MRSAWKPVDLLQLFFLALLSSVTLIFNFRIDAWGLLILRYGVLAAAIVLTVFYRSTVRTGKPFRYFNLLLPTFVVVVIFDSLGHLIPSLFDTYFDNVLIEADFALFGVHPTVWMERLINPYLTDLLQLVYASYYFIPISLGLVLVAKNKQTEFDWTIFGIILCFYLSYIGYIVVPAIGPRFTLSDLQTAGLQGSVITTTIQETLNTLENNKTDAFPSGHTAVALITLYYAWKTREKTLTRIFIPLVSLLIFSTVYLRYHYVVDVIAGILLTGLTIVIAGIFYKRLPGSHSHQLRRR